MSKRAEVKQEAQDLLMQAMQVAFNGIYTDLDEDAVREEMDKQMRRVEKLFGYQEGSWNRGA